MIKVQISGFPHLLWFYKTLKSTLIPHKSSCEYVNMTCQFSSFKFGIRKTAKTYFQNSNI